ncbi:MAG: FecR family protein [Steroidobacteraceae bacterium]
MLGRKKSDQTIRQEATEWVTLLDSVNLSDAQRREFLAWLEGDPRHGRELNRSQAVVLMIQDLLPDHKAALRDSAFAPEASLAEFGRSFGRPLQFAGIAVAAAAILVIGAWPGLRPVGEFFTHTYATATGESRTVVLQDGSVAHLNTQSRIRWSGAGKDRRVALERGEVLFEVAHDPTRPFRVIVGNSEIRDLATEFDVYRKFNGSVVVTVLSGQVVVKELATGRAQPAWAQRQLKPNEQIEYTPASVIADVHSTDAPKSVRWREGLLETKGQSFATIVSELNRYSTKRILVADPRIDAADINIGGSLGIHDVPATLERIQKIAPIVVTDAHGAYILTYKPDTSVTEHSNAPQQHAAGRP